MSARLAFGPIVRSATGHETDDDFDYACSVARAEAIDAILLQVLEDRGWDLFDEWVLKHVRLEHAGKRTRVLVEGVAVTPWWQDRLEETDGAPTWRFEPVEPHP